ncbi:adenine phosphoribosyltransferase [Weissella diestrammenae]|uniref:Adenine phosphoribosyltransferase n=1 Tax=Weissella diestrammenae TaxID=1162633 RepID=A0A7G9T5V2_9LACO|nr:phosphoribosyltransferase family protein [Weissella diestrammenae]MCM0582307.1 adenine phosphoribosyltransferase [Weissella diestrammenae]QNN75477.1 adenine phosphoribosyltransferase [Weissella diestrammenae]
MVKSYLLTVGDYTRRLPIIPIDETHGMAVFVLLGDARMTHESAKLLVDKIPDNFDYLVTTESMGIPLVHEMSVLSLHSEYIVLRQSKKIYMQSPIAQKDYVDRWGNTKNMYLDAIDSKRLVGKKVVIVDDIVTSGASMAAASELLKSVGAKVVAQAAILAEGDAVHRKDLVFLEGLPLFEQNGDDFEPVSLD